MPLVQSIPFNGPSTAEFELAHSLIEAVPALVQRTTVLPLEVQVKASVALRAAQSLKFIVNHTSRVQAMYTCGEAELAQLELATDKFRDDLAGAYKVINQSWKVIREAEAIRRGDA